MGYAYIVSCSGLGAITDSLMNFKQTVTFTISGRHKPLIVKVTKIEATMNDDVLIITGTVRNHRSKPQIVISYNFSNRNGETTGLDYVGLN